MYQYSSQMYGTQWESHMGISSNMSKIVGSEHFCFDPFKSPQGVCENASKNIFQAQEQEQNNQIDEVPSSWCFEFPKTITTEYPSGDNFTTKQDQPSNSQFTNSLYSVAESFLSSSGDSHSSSEKHSKFQCYSEKQKTFQCYSEKHSDFQPENVPCYDQFVQEHNDRLLRDDAATDERPPFEISFQINQPEKQGPRNYGVACVTSSNCASRRGKRRIRWTKDLHEPFMMIVNRLGGPEKAKPKAILEMMKSDLLSISHVKSHLQKCRTTIHTHKALQEKSEEGHNRTDGVTELQVKIHMQIEESRQLQLEVRRSISQQLEMQRNLQRLIEEQSKQLNAMLDHQKERTNTGENSLSQKWK